MTKLTSLALATFATNLLVGCVTGDNLPPPDDVVANPQSCTEIANGSKTAKDGDYTLYIGGDADRAWTAYCVDMQSAPKEYLTLPNGGDNNWSRFIAGGSAVGTDVTTRFDKVRVDPMTLKIDIGDKTFAVSTGSLTYAGTVVTSMPFGVAMSCGGHAGGQIDIQHTPFQLTNNLVTAGGTNPTGYADPWANDRVIEFWADGDCAWTAPDGTPANPMNDAGGFLIQLD